MNVLMNNVLDRNDISEIGAMVLRCNEMGNVKWKDIVVEVNYEEKSFIVKGKGSDGEYYEKLWVRINNFKGMLDWIRGFYEWLKF